ncbi:MAG: competence protein CoiA family protein [Coriobacteriia bacterium]
MCSEAGNDGLLVPFALRNSELVHISAVANDGRQGYTCPKCHQRVVPNLCTKKRSHFSHYAESPGCIGALETALHLAAKQVLRRHEAIMVPNVVIEHRGQSHTIRTAQYEDYSTVRTEKSFGGTRPDAALIRPGKDSPLLVEVFVTHAVDAAKKAKLTKMAYPCLEVDVVHAFRGDGYDEEELERILIHSDDAHLKKWVCIPHEDRHIARIEAQIKAAEAEERRQRQASEAARRRRLEQSAAEARRRQERLDSARKARGIVPSDSFGAHVNIEVAHEFVFSCPRGLWQRTLCRQYVGRGYAENDNQPGAPVDVSDAELWLHQHRGHLIRHEYSLDEESNAHFVGLAAAEYFDGLERLGFVRSLLRHEGMLYHNLYEILRAESSAD